MNSARIILIVLLAAIAAAVVPTVAAGKAAPSATPPALEQAKQLSVTWGRCSSSRPAHRLLSIANRTRPVRARTVRSRAALRAWRVVERECGKPVAQPTVSVSGGGYLPPGG